MRRILVALCLTVTAGACVTLDKPEKVAECAKTNTCVNIPVLDAATGSDAGDSLIEGPRPTLDSGTVEPDGSTLTDDAPLSPADVTTAPGDETGVPVLPDGPDDQAGTTYPETGLVGQPDASPDFGAGQTGDGPTNPDQTIVIPDAAIGTADAAPDTPADIAPDTRDAYRDVAVGICAPGGVIQPAGTVCREAAGACDIDETCDGVHADCPADVLAAAGTSCRVSAGDCDIAETCSGTSADCPADGFKQAGTVCRATAGVCDVAESCTGTSASCPVDSFAPSETVCRASTDDNKCDPEEDCTGSGVTCPADAKYTAPTVPAGVSATAGAAGTLTVTVSWNAATDATGYNVKQSTTNGGGYTTLLSTPTTTALSYTDTGLTPSTPYYYVISAINTVPTCESADSPQVNATPTGACVPPTAPNVTAAAGNGVVTLTWPAVSGAVSYSVARSLTTGTGYATVATVTTGTGYTDGNVVNGTTYYYVVTASNGTCSSGNSTEKSASPACTPPSAITDLIATPADGSVSLTWTAPPGATSYRIYSNTTGGTSYTLTGTSSTASFTDTNVVNGTKYYYVVTSSNGSCSSDSSNQATTTPACQPPSPPSAVLATAGDGQVTLSWTAPSGAVSYKVYRGTSAGGESSTALATPTTTNYVDTAVTNGTTYYYVVTASNGSCSSGNSLEASTTPVCTPPSVPGTLTATKGDGQVTLTWGASAPLPATSYTIARKTGAGGTYADLSTHPTVTTYTDTGLVNNTTYYYKVSASNGSCSSAFNTEVSATPQAVCTQTAPGSPAASPSGSVQVTITWTASTPTPTNYGIGRSTTSGSGYTSIGTVGGTVLTYTDTDISLLNGTRYYYQITAVGTVCTATSAETSAIPTCSTPAVPNPSASNANGAITISWPTIAGATAYTVYRSTSSGGTYTEISTNQTAATYVDGPSGLTNGSTYYYKVSASNANHQCASVQSAATNARSCTIPAAPTGLSAKRAGNKQVTLVWTNSPGTNNYSVQRSTSSGSGYTQVGTTTGTSYTDTVPSNTVRYYYVVTARSDSGGNCSSGNSSQVAVPVCTEVTGGGSSQKQNDNSEWCLVTCDDINWWSDSGLGDRKLYINTVQTDTSGALPLPAKGNSGYAFYFTASSNGTGNYAYWNYGAGTTHTCP